jgi:hypothetical protein
MFDLNNLGGMLEEIQKKSKEFESINSDKTYTVKSGGGLISVTINGAVEIIDISIDDTLLEDKDSMQILLISAINEAIKIADDNRKKDALQMLGNFNLFQK